MAFTPRSLSNGDHVKINQDISNEEGVFSAGHEFMIIDQHVRDGVMVYDLRDHDLNVLGEVPSSCLERFDPP